MSCVVYVATYMTGRDKAEMVARAKYVCAVLRQYGITPISPILEEKVDGMGKGVLVNDNRERLKGFWNRDKFIIRRPAHVVLIDGADAKSFGVEREYGLSRWCIWKPTILLMPSKGLTVAEFEDDYITSDLHEAASFIREHFGSRLKRWKWRADLLNRCLPGWILDQLYAWR